VNDTSNSTPEAGGFTDHERAQRKAWLALTYAQRLAWLEQAKSFATRHCGAASRGPGLSDPG
jgi:hypothetical protein